MEPTRTTDDAIAKGHTARRVLAAHLGYDGGRRVCVGALDAGSSQHWGASQSSSASPTPWTRADRRRSERYRRSALAPVPPINRALRVMLNTRWSAEVLVMVGVGSHEEGRGLNVSLCSPQLPQCA
jgi:hypothetical protein